MTVLSRTFMFRSRVLPSIVSRCQQTRPDRDPGGPFLEEIHFWERLPDQKSLGRFHNAWGALGTARRLPWKEERVSRHLCRGCALGLCSASSPARDMGGIISKKRKKTEEQVPRRMVQNSMGRLSVSTGTRLKICFSHD